MKRAYVEEALGNVGCINILSLVVRIRVQSLVGDCVVQEQRLEILLSVAAEEEAVDAGAKSLESTVRRSKQGGSGVSRCIVESFQKTSLDQPEFEGAELSGQEGDDVSGVGRWDEEAVDAVDDTVGTKLEQVSQGQ